MARGFAAQAEEVKESKSSEQKLVMKVITPFKTHMCDGPPLEVETTPRELLHMYHTMNVMRRMEITADMLFKSQLVRGFCHLYDGQEAVAVGLCAALTPEDAILGAYRIHGPYLARGGTPYEVFTELMGRGPGCAGGKGGSMHLYDVKRKFFGGWGIVGSSGPLGTGLALGQKYLKEKAVTATMFGDGAANQGQIYEAYNIAALWSIPTIYVVENNHYGMGTSETRASAMPTFYNRVNYMPGVKVDGMDVLAVKGAIKYCKEFALEHGPIIAETDTYRYHGHSMSDPGSTYRERSEIQDMRHTRDPIHSLRHRILEEGVASEEELKAIEDAAKQEVKEAAEKAREAAAPEESELWTHIYRQDKGVMHHGVNRRETAVTMS